MSDKSADPVFSLERKLDLHIEHCDAEFESGRQEFAKLRACLEANTAALMANTQSVDDVDINTKDIVEAWKSIQGAARVGVTVQKVGIWIVKWPLIGTGLFAIFKWFGDNAPK